MDWISVKDRLPENNNGYFVVMIKDALQKRITTAQYFFKQDGSQVIDKHEAFWEIADTLYINRPFEIIYWIAIPELPEGV